MNSARREFGARSRSVIGYTVFDYNEDNLVTCRTNPLGQTTRTTWDRYRRKTTETDQLGHTTRYQYDKDGRLNAVVDWRSRKTLLEYDTNGHLIAKTHPDGGKQLWRYDQAGQVVSAIARNGFISSNSYDALGRRISHTASDGCVTKYEYDASGNLFAAVIDNDVRQEWKRDLLGRLSESTDPYGYVTRYEYAPLAALNREPFEGRGPVAGAHRSPLTVLLPNDDRYTFEYSSEGLTTAVNDAAGGTTRYVWGQFDLLRSKTDQAGCATQYEYDSYARVIKITNALGDTWHFNYDAAGQLVGETDFNHRTTRYQYDSVGRLQSKIVADWLQTRYVWDEYERLAIIETDDRRIEYKYDDQDRMTCARRFDDERIESEIHWFYNEEGRIIKTVQDGKKISWDFDATGRQIARHTPAGSSTQTHDKFGLLQSLRTPSGDIFIERDKTGREIGRSSVPMAELSVVGPAFVDLTPNLPTPSHFHLRQQYDAVGRLLEQQISAASSAKSVVGDASTTLRRYHWQQGNLVGIDDPRFGNTRYANDARGQVVRTEYDLKYAYTSTESQIAQESFAYDRIGNIGSRDAAQPNQLNAPVRAVPQSYTAGKVTHCGDVSYRYDPAGRMVERTVHRNGYRPQTWEFRWDGFDRTPYAG